MAIYSADIFTDVPLRKRTRTSIKKVYTLKGKIMLESVKHDSDSSELSDDEDMKPPSPSHTVSMTKFPFQTSFQSSPVNWVLANVGLAYPDSVINLCHISIRIRPLIATRKYVNLAIDGKSIT